MSPRANKERDAGLTRDAFLGGRLTILQPEAGPRAGIDAVLLAAAVPAVAGRRERVLEAGMGSGVVSLALARRVEDVHVTGIEIQPELADLAEENARLNGLQARVSVLCADATQPLSRLEALGLAPDSFDHVAANPPFHAEGRVRLPKNTVKQRAHMGSTGDLERWIKLLTALAAPGGSITLIHRADAVAEILAALDRRFGGVIVFPLFPRSREAATRVIVQGVKGSRAPLRLAPGLVLHDAAGGFTPEAEAILRHGAGLPLL